MLCLFQIEKESAFNPTSDDSFVAGYRLQGSGVESFACHPGLVRTDIFRKADHDKLASVTTDWAQWLSGQTAESGALPLLYCATAPELEGGHSLG